MEKKLRIGVLAPIAHAFPPPAYGPWERVAYDLVEGLVELGHDVTVFAPEGSRSSATRIVCTSPQPLEGSGLNHRLAEEQHVARAMEAAADREFDVLHSHLHVHALGYSRIIPCPLVTTLHGAAWDRAHHPILEAYGEQPYVSISNAERRFLPGINYIATVYNGIRVEDFDFQPTKGDYLVFAGRMAPEKGPDLAIASARQSGRRLFLAGQIESRHGDYFESKIRPSLGSEVEYLGEQPRHDLAKLVAGASALLMPLRWEEPFGLVVVEALATGTPVVAWNRGAMPEIIEDGRHGFLVDSVKGAADAIARLGEIDPRHLRTHVEERFSRTTMAASYIDAYKSVLA